MASSVLATPAHAPPPTSGQRSSQAPEDAEALALLLGHDGRSAYEARATAGAVDGKQAIKAAAK